MSENSQDMEKLILIKKVREDSKMVFDYLEENLDKVPVDMLQKIAASGARLKTLMVK